VLPSGLHVVEHVAHEELRLISKVGFVQNKPRSQVVGSVCLASNPS
jgi:hypothetical protein